MSRPAGTGQASRMNDSSACVPMQEGERRRYQLRCWYLRVPACAKIIAGQESANVQYWRILVLFSHSISPPMQSLSHKTQGWPGNLSSRTGGSISPSSTPLPVCHNSDRNHDSTALESRCAAFMILQWKTWDVVDAVLRAADFCQKEIDLC